MEIEYNRQFVKQRDKCSAYICQTLAERLELFKYDRKSPLLHDHALGGNLQGLRSINITGDWRALYKELDGGSKIRFMAIGTHSQLYRQ